MAKDTKIEWSNSTQNFWIGCEKVSEACKFCYMFRDLNRYKQFDPKGYTRVSDKTFYQALKWKDSRRIFTCSWSDFFLEAADADRPDAWRVIKDTPWHTWLILTKRPERILDNLPSDWGQWLSKCLDWSYCGESTTINRTIGHIGKCSLFGQIHISRTNIRSHRFI